MRAVFQFPASMVSVVDAPRAVNSEASPTRPLCAVRRRSTPAAAAAAVNRRPRLAALSPPKTGVSGAAPPRSARSARGAAFEIAYVGGVALLVGLRLADGEQEAVLGGGLRHVAPGDRGGFTAA